METIHVINTNTDITKDYVIGDEYTVKSLKYAVVQNEGIEFQDVYLFFNGKQLTNENILLTAIGIREGSKVYIAKTLLLHIIGYPTTLVPKGTFNTRILENISIGALKDKITSQITLARKGQLLAYNQTVLDDNKMLSDYNIKTDSTLVVSYASTNLYDNIPTFNKTYIIGFILICISLLLYVYYYKFHLNQGALYDIMIGDRNLPEYSLVNTQLNDAKTRISNKLDELNPIRTFEPRVDSGKRFEMKKIKKAKKYTRKPSK